MREEIAHWLETVGSVSRLVLLQVDPAIELQWTGDALEPSAALPEPLRQLFTEEQKWIVYTGRRWRRQVEGMAGLCADLLQVQPREFLVEEADFLRRRTRTVSVVAAVTALALVAAVISGVVAVRNAAEAQANATQATAQADAAEALLAATEAPTVGIELVLRAASHSDSPTIRSAMLAVSRAARRLKHAFVYPENETGHPATGAAFSVDGAKLMAWGAGSVPGSSLVRVWNIATAAAESSTAVSVSGLTNVAYADATHLVACSDAGPIVMDLPANRVTRLDETWSSRGTCSVDDYPGGVIALGVRDTGDGAVLSLDRTGVVTRIDGVDSVAVNVNSHRAMVAGRGGCSC